MKTIASMTVLLFLAACSFPGDVGGPSDPFPKDGFLGGWKKKGKTTLFDGANLYGHINGGAEVFFELGFDRLLLQRYVKGSDEIDLELYWMTENASALGIYLMNCGEEHKDPGLNARHTASRYQLQLVQGSAYLKVNNQSVTPGAGGALKDFARYVEEHLPVEEMPDPFDNLPKEARVAGSERILRGPFTLEQLFFLGEGDVLNLQGKVFAMAAAYQDESGEEFIRIRADYPDGDSANAAFAQAASILDPRLERVSKEEARLVFRDGEGKYGELLLQGSRMDVKVGLPENP